MMAPITPRRTIADATSSASSATARHAVAYVLTLSASDLARIAAATASGCVGAPSASWAATAASAAAGVVSGGDDGSHGGVLVPLVVRAERPEPKLVDDGILRERVLEARDREYGSHQSQAGGVQRGAFRAVQQVVVSELFEQVVLVLHQREDAADGVARAMRARVVAAEVLVPLFLILQYLRQGVHPERRGRLS